MLGDFVSRHNHSFALPAAVTGAAYRQMRPDLHLDSVLCFKYVRSVANDNTVRFGSSTIQLLADEHRASYARAKVEVQERLDGTIVVAYQGTTLACVPAPPGPVMLRARGGARHNGRSVSHQLGDGVYDATHAR